MKCRGIREKRLGKDLYLHGEAGETLTVLNASGMLIWSLCDGRHRLEDMVSILQECMPDTPRSELCRDITECLESLRQHDLITEGPHEQGERHE